MIHTAVQFLLGILCMISATLVYLKGETDSFLGKPNKWIKTLMGIPIGLLYMAFYHLWIQGALVMLTYFIALQFGYGDNNWTVKLFGKRGAVTFCGCLMGLASAPILLWWAILATILSGLTFYELDALNAEIKEPWVAILRGIGGTVCYL